MDSRRSVRQFLQWLRASGVTHLPPVCLPKETRPQLKQPAARGQAARSQPQIAKTAASLQIDSSGLTAPEPFPQTTQITAKQFSTNAEKAEGLAQLADVVAGCQRCSELAERRKQTVFGVGDPDARVMFVGEAPGADEDRQGEPFVGAAGQLLNKIIEACGWKREELYICNILRCRPPGNRNPRPQEALNCREFLDAQIQIVQPEYIVCWGTVAAQNLLGETRPVGRLRGELHHHENAKVMCTYHPSYLLRNPSAKKQVWEDMQFLMAEMEKNPPQ